MGLHDKYGEALSLLENARLALDACDGPQDCCGETDNGRHTWPLKLELLHRIQEFLKEAPRSHELPPMHKLTEADFQGWAGNAPRTLALNLRLGQQGADDATAQRAFHDLAEQLERELNRRTALDKIEIDALHDEADRRSSVSSTPATAKYEVRFKQGQHHIYLKDYAVRVATFAPGIGEPDRNAIVNGANGVGVSAIAAPTHPNGLWMVYYEDASVKPEIFFGEDAERAARKRYATARDNWSCHLLSRWPDPDRTVTSATADGGTNG